ncbi:protein windpipe [Drosophila innubila]|uniref:protein windpipe n=1 Tax=Drosophila innubila TaxID=198719 RepID=UPI00148D0E09|nr:protein windpipe [Drosophila innubila]XP_034479933.1 protein windpipe [Drosophila innubila]
MERLHLPVLLALLLCVCGAIASPAPVPAAAPYHCPEDCTCTLSQHTHIQTLHAKCQSTKGLKLREEPVQASIPSIPIHSIDLSYLGLTRLGHVLDHLVNLTSVDLSHNELHEIGHLSKRIKKLNLKHNRLTSVKLLKLPQHLQVLNLQHNDITYLPKELTHLQHLQQLELGHNNINCSCSTLEVRNWLQEQHVYMDKAVICHQPTEARGKSWLQLKQSEICEKERNGWYANDVDENELMLGNQSLEEEEELQELGTDYLLIGNKRAVRQATMSESAAEPAAPIVSDVEGSGDLSETHMENVAAFSAGSSVEEPKTQALQQDEPEPEEEGSGSGDGIVDTPHVVAGPHNPDDFEPTGPKDNDSDNDNDGDKDYDNKPVEQPATPSADIFKNNNQGIFEQNPEEVSEEPIVPVVHTNLDTAVQDDVVTDGPLSPEKPSEDILAAKVGRKDDSSAIYYLLGVIALIVVGLILFVAIKRCKYNSNAAARDAEAQRQTELLDMDKKNLGKPLTRNGHEHSPLIGEKSKSDEAQIVNGSGKKPYDSKDNAGQQPLLNGNGTANGDAKDVPTINEPSTGETAPHEYYPITPRYPTPQSPRASKYAQHPQGEQAEQNNNNNNELDGAYLPSSPKSGRYSPVYSPETGRVKIKLTETPKPKTPMLVTRSKSNAGDIITTPVQSGGYLEPTHQVAALAAGPNGFANH